MELHKKRKKRINFIILLWSAIQLIESVIYEETQLTILATCNIFLCIKIFQVLWTKENITAENLFLTVGNKFVSIKALLEHLPVNNSDENNLILDVEKDERFVIWMLKIVWDHLTSIMQILYFILIYSVHLYVILFTSNITSSLLIFFSLLTKKEISKVFVDGKKTLPKQVTEKQLKDILTIMNIRKMTSADTNEKSGETTEERRRVQNPEMKDVSSLASGNDQSNASTTTANKHQAERQDQTPTEHHIENNQIKPEPTISKTDDAKKESETSANQQAEETPHETTEEPGRIQNTEVKDVSSLPSGNERPNASATTVYQHEAERQEQTPTDNQIQNNQIQTEAKTDGTSGVNNNQKGEGTLKETTPFIQGEDYPKIKDETPPLVVESISRNPQEKNRTKKNIQCERILEIKSTKISMKNVVRNDKSNTSLTKHEVRTVKKSIPHSENDEKSQAKKETAPLLDTKETATLPDTTETAPPPETNATTPLPETKETAPPPQTTEDASQPETKETEPPLETKKTAPWSQTKVKAPPPETKETATLPETKETEPLTDTKETEPPPETKETEPPPETKETASLPETEEREPPPETKETAPPPETKETAPPPDTKETALTPEIKEAAALPETKETAPPPETKEAAALPETKETAPLPETKETAPPPETKETALTPETKEAAALPETKEPAALPETKETAPLPDTKEPAPIPKTNATASLPETKETPPLPETKETEPPPETKETSPSSQTKETAPPPEAKVKAPPHETKETATLPETKKTEPLSVTKETAPLLETEETAPLPETKEDASLPETEETAPPPETKETAPPPETKETAPTPETKKAAALTETRETKPLSETKETAPLPETKVTNKSVKMETDNGIETKTMPMSQRNYDSGRNVETDRVETPDNEIDDRMGHIKSPTTNSAEHSINFQNIGELLSEVTHGLKGVESSIKDLTRVFQIYHRSKSGSRSKGNYTISSHDVASISSSGGSEIATDFEYMLGETSNSIPKQSIVSDSDKWKHHHLKNHRNQSNHGKGHGNDYNVKKLTQRTDCFQQPGSQKDNETSVEVLCRGIENLHLKTEHFYQTTDLANCEGLSRVRKNLNRKTEHFYQRTHLANLEGFCGSKKNLNIETERFYERTDLADVEGLHRGIKNLHLETKRFHQRADLANLEIDATPKLRSPIIQSNSISTPSTMDQAAPSTLDNRGRSVSNTHRMKRKDRTHTKKK